MVAIEFGRRFEPLRQPVIDVLIVDDQRIARSGLHSMLDGYGDINVVGEAEHGLRGVEMSREHRPDVVLMDIRMPVMDGIEATKRLVAGREPPHVIVLTTFDVDELVYEALKAGASGFLLKDADADEIARAIREAVAGHAVIDPAVTKRIIERFVQFDQVALEIPLDLSSREIEVLKEVATGANNAEIAGSLFVSEATVKSHVHSILTKCRLRDRTQAIILAYETGLVRPGGVEPHQDG
jgi:DNA-binding NarL/FixJ family response regulator